MYVCMYVCKYKTSDDRETREHSSLRVSRTPVRFALALARLAPKDNACSAGYFLNFFFT